MENIIENNKAFRTTNTSSHTTSKASQTRKKIIASAKTLFRKHGYQNTTMQMIADEAGNSLSLVKKYFPKKAFLTGVIARNQAFEIKQFVDEKLKEIGFPHDALMEYLLTINISFRGLYADSEVRRYHYEMMSINISEDSLSAKPYDYISELYSGIIKQFNTSMSPNEFEARKIQIYGAQTAIGESYVQKLSKYDDLERLEYSVSAACILLGVSRFVYESYKEKADEILKDIDYKKFSLL